MRKSDLKDGYVVKYRNGNLRMVISINDGMALVGDHGQWMDVAVYNDNLTNSYENSSQFDIVEVWGRTDLPNRALNVGTANRKSIWVRTSKQYYIKSSLKDSDGFNLYLLKTDKGYFLNAMSHTLFTDEQIELLPKSIKGALESGLFIKCGDSTL